MSNYAREVKAFNWAERYWSSNGCVSENYARN